MAMVAGLVVYLTWGGGGRYKHTHRKIFQVAKTPAHTNEPKLKNNGSVGVSVYLHLSPEIQNAVDEEDRYFTVSSWVFSERLRLFTGSSTH